MQIENIHDGVYLYRGYYGSDCGGACIKFNTIQTNKINEKRNLCGKNSIHLSSQHLKVTVFEQFNEFAPRARSYSTPLQPVLEHLTAAFFRVAEILGFDSVQL